MKRLLLFLWLFAVSLPAFGANPSYDAFIGTNGIIVSSNPPQGRVIIDGGALTLGALLWTNEPSGRIHPTVFTNRVEVQRVFTVGTNSSGLITLNSNDLFVGYRDLAKGERIAPKFTAGIFSNTFSSTLNAFFDHRTSTFESRVIDGNGNFDSLISWGARANASAPYIALNHTNGISTFSFDSTNHMVLNNVGYFWPPAQGAAGTVLTNNGAGTLGWGTAAGGGGDSLWTNEPSGRIHPIEFTNRVELQRSLVIGTNYASFGGAVGTNDFIVAYRDIALAEDYSPRVEFGVFSNAVFSYIAANLLRNKSSWSIANKSESTHQSTTEIGADSSGPLLVMVNTNSTVLFGVNGETNITFQGIVYAFPPAQGAAQTVLTNDGFGNLGWGAGGGGGGVNFSDLVWTNQLGTIKPIAFPTNILFNVAATEGGVQTNFYFESRVYRTNAATKLFAIYNGGSNAVTVGPYGGLFMGRANQTPYPGVTISGIYDTAKGETNQQEIFVMSQNSAVGYLGAADILVDTNYGAIILTSQSPGGTRFSRWAIQAGAGIDPEKFNTFSMQALVDNATYFQVDPNFTLLTPTNYLFSSSVRITNTHTLLSLQNSNFPVLEVDGVGDLRLIKKVPYLWPDANAAGVLNNDGAGLLSWGAAGGGPSFADLVWTNTTVMIVPITTAATALRHGVTNGTQWASTNIGVLSVAFGSNNAAGGYISSVLGGSRNSISTNTRLSVIVGGDNNLLGNSGGGRNFIGGGNGHTFGSGASNSVVVGGEAGTIDADIGWATIVGGQTQRIRSQYAFIGGGTGNDARSQGAVIGGGANNVSGDGAGLEDVSTFVGGGEQNVASAAYMTIGGGRMNGTANGDNATNGVIAGGLGNFINSIHSTISGGALNTIGNLGAGQVIAGGFTNEITTVSDATFAFISGGVSNRILSAPLGAIVGFFGSNSTPKSILMSPAGTHGSNIMHVTATATTNIGPLEVREFPGRSDGSLKLWQTNSRGYTEFTVTNGVMSTNRIVWSLGSNTVAANDLFTVHSTTIADGINNIVVTNKSASAGVLSGTTNYINLSVQAAKLPATNYPNIDAGWQAWETVYPETNDVGSRVNLSANWQFMVPTDYAPNTLKLLINYSLLATNGPNTSNVVWGVSVLPIRSGTTNNVHTNVFLTAVKGSNDWISKYDGTNIVTNLVISLGTIDLLPRDLAVIKLERFPTEDTYGGAVAVHGLQAEYTRP